MPTLQLPQRPVPDRASLTRTLPPGARIAWAELDGPGCIRHLWFTLERTGTMGRTTILRITFDNATVPQIEAPLADFFGCLHGTPWYPVNTPWFSVQAASGYNCYLPMPFATSARIEVENTADTPTTAYGMVDWHRYPGQALEERRRLCARWRREMPTRRYGEMFTLLDADGPGELLGFAYGVRLIDNTDRWSHGGADNIYLDGEGDEPAYLRGIGGEDTFGTSYGGALHDPETHLHTGLPLYTHEDDGTARPAQRVAGYRLFDADPVPFAHSIHMRFGCMENDICATAYWYSEAPVRPFCPLPEADRLLPGTPLPRDASPLALPCDGHWWLCGPFDNRDGEAMATLLPPEVQLAPEKTYDGRHAEGSPWLADGSKALGRDVARWVKRDAIHGFVDFNHVFQPPVKGVGVFGEGVSVARCVLTAPADLTARLRIAWDDELHLRINGGEPMRLGHHGAFRVQTLDVPLKAGGNTVALKLSNTRGSNHGGWAFAFRATTSDGTLLKPQAG